MSETEYNPLLARRRRKPALTLCLLAGLGLAATGAFAVGSQTPAAPHVQAQIASNAPAQAPGAGAKSGAETAPQCRQVRVIPLFNSPANPTGLAAR